MADETPPFDEPNEAGRIAAHVLQFLLADVATLAQGRVVVAMIDKMLPTVLPDD
jgi:hypothetical protein